MSDAQMCRENGWTVGTRLVGDEGYGPSLIEITAIGETNVLAKQITPKSGSESCWTLSCRDWAVWHEATYIVTPRCATDRGMLGPLSLSELSEVGFNIGSSDRSRIVREGTTS